LPISSCFTIWFCNSERSNCARNERESTRMPEGPETAKLRLTCPPCGEVFSAEDEDTLMAMALEHARKFHDLDLLEHQAPDDLRALVRRENELYWTRIAHLIPEGQVKTVIEEKLCHREREIVSYVVHGFANRAIAGRLFISERTVSTHLVNIYEKLNVHSRAELAAIVRATDRIVEAALRGGSTEEFGPFVHTKDPNSR
jgi:DNA-binding CsgD family transcriptional regulator/predicted small metal-binding protein